MARFGSGAFFGRNGNRKLGGNNENHGMKPLVLADRKARIKTPTHERTSPQLREQRAALRKRQVQRIEKKKLKRRQTLAAIADLKSARRRRWEKY